MIFFECMESCSPWRTCRTQLFGFGLSIGNVVHVSLVGFAGDLEGGV